MIDERKIDRITPGREKINLGPKPLPRQCNLCFLELVRLQDYESTQEVKRNTRLPLVFLLTELRTSRVSPQTSFVL